MSKSAELKARKAAAVPNGVGSRGIYVAKAENSELWDVDGRRYIDFAAGIAVVNTGHRHPRVMEAVAQQAQAFAHTCFHVAPYESYVRLAERLNALAPGDFAKKTLFLNSGAEAVENAIKIARYYTKRSAVIAFSGGFHGRTLMTMALTGKVMPYKRGFGPFPAEVYHAEFPQPYRGITTEQALADLDRLFHGDVDPKSVAAIIIEPVQGEGGFNVAPADFLRALRRLCDEHGIVMIADEVQGGIARTGKMFSIEHCGRRARSHHRGQGTGRRLPAVGRDGPRHHHGCGACRRLGRHLRRQSHQHRGGACGTGCDRGRGTVPASGQCRRQNAHPAASRLPRNCPASAMCAVWAPWWPSNWSRIPKTKEPDAELTAAILTHAETRGLISAVLRYGG